MLLTSSCTWSDIALVKERNPLLGALLLPSKSNRVKSQLTILTFLLGTPYTSQFISYNFSGSNHIDPGDKIPSLGWWCHHGSENVVGGYWWFSRINALVYFNPSGTLMLFDGAVDEHGTGVFSKKNKGLQIGSVMILKKDLYKIIKRYYTLWIINMLG